MTLNGLLSSVFCYSAVIPGSLRRASVERLLVRPHWRGLPILFLLCDRNPPDRPAAGHLNAFFANVISGWEVAVDQSGGIKSSDLQAAKISGTSFSMNHKMGLLKIILGTKQISTIRWYNLAESSYEDSSEKTTITASSNFQTNIPYSSNYLYVVNPAKSTTLKTPDSDTRKWSLAANSQVTSGNYKEVTVIPNKNDFIYKGWKITYAGSYQTFNKGTKAGKYKLEVYGGQGGDGYEWNETATTTIVADAGGKGGYTYGEVTLIASQTLYVCTGGKGTVAGRTANVRAAGGYNGGGAGGTEQSETVPESASGGGGATHIATKLRSDGQLKNYYNYSSEVLIVAGGGGGASGTFPVGWNTTVTDAEWSSWNGYKLDGKTSDVTPCYGGAGGSTGAGTKTNSYTTAGVASGGSSTYFGVGQNGFVGTASNYGGIGGGGGGWFGGTCTSSYNNPLAAAGAGGSGHVNTSSVSAYGGTVGYNSGNGWARIRSTFEW